MPAWVKKVCSQLQPLSHLGFWETPHRLYRPKITVLQVTAAIEIQGLNNSNGTPVTFVGRDAFAGGTGVEGVEITGGSVNNPGGGCEYRKHRRCTVTRGEHKFLLI